MRRLLAKIVDIRKGEGLLTLLMFSYYYLILVTYYLLKPARDSLFLVKLGASQLPLVFIVTALIIAPITTIYASASRSLRLTRLIYVTSALVAANLIILRWLLTLDGSWVFYLFYVWVSIYGALTASQYWLFANAVYTPSQGKRLFAFLNLGGILGAMTGGEVTAFIIRRFGVATEDLLFICVGIVSSFAILAAAIWRIHQRDAEEPAQQRRSRKTEQKDSLGQMFSMITRSRHLTYLVGIIALTMATASFVDYQFKTISVQSFPEKEGLTSFLGVFYSRLSLVSLLLQTLFTYRFLRLLGVGGMIMFLPVSLMLGSVYMFIVPGLVAAILLRGSDGAFKYSLDKTGRELLFLPVPLEVKKRTKVFIDMFVDRWFRGVAGAVLLLLTTVLGLGVRELSLFVIAMLGAWLFLAFRIRKEYVNAFRLAIARREIDPSQVSVNVSDPSTLTTLRESLRSSNEREINYALDMLADLKEESLIEDILPLLDNPSRDVHLRVLHLLDGLGADVEESHVARLIRSEDAEVRLAAMKLVCSDRNEAARDVVEKYLGDDDPRVASTALRCAAESDGAGARPLITPERIAEFIGLTGDYGDEVRMETARALGAVEDAELNAYLHGLMHDESVAVAKQAILAAGRTKDREFVTELLDLLANPRLRSYTRDALAAYGDGVVGTLGDYLSDASVPMSVRRNIPAVLTRIPTQQSVEVLSSHLATGDTALRTRTVKALNKLRRRYPELSISAGSIDSAFVEETKMYYEALEIAALQRGNGTSSADQLLERALNERLSANLERAFRLLGLHYPADDIYNAYLGVVSTQRDRQASALELLDNVLGKNLKKYLFPIIDQVSEGETIRRGRHLFQLDIKTRDDALLQLMCGHDAWLRACAVYSATTSESPKVRAAVRAAKEDPDPVVAEAAGLVAGSA